MNVLAIDHVRQLGGRRRVMSMLCSFVNVASRRRIFLRCTKFSEEQQREGCMGRG